MDIINIITLGYIVNLLFLGIEEVYFYSNINKNQSIHKNIFKISQLKRNYIQLLFPFSSILYLYFIIIGYKNYKLINKKCDIIDYYFYKFNKD